MFVDGVILVYETRGLNMKLDYWKKALEIKYFRINVETQDIKFRDDQKA